MAKAMATMSEVKEKMVTLAEYVPWRGCRQERAKAKAKVKWPTVIPSSSLVGGAHLGTRLGGNRAWLAMPPCLRRHNAWGERPFTAVGKGMRPQEWLVGQTAGTDVRQALDANYCRERNRRREGKRRWKRNRRRKGQRRRNM